LKQQTPDEIPLKVLICDGDSNTAETLQRALEGEPPVLVVEHVNSTNEARSRVRSGDYSIIFIDPLTLDIEEASSFVFELCKSLPEIVFVLYVDRARAERQRGSFYRGERQRFSHYYTLDKQTPVLAFGDEVLAIQSDLSWRMTAASLKRLRSEAAKITSDGTCQ
jgi:hypothetical protein